MNKTFRVKKSHDIEQIIKKRQSVGSKYFVIYKNKCHEVDHYRVAISVSKKYGNAVARNKIKRQVRAILQNINLNNQYDIFVVIKPLCKELNFNQIKKELTRLIIKHKLKGENNEQV